MPGQHLPHPELLLPPSLRPSKLLRRRPWAVEGRQARTGCPQAVQNIELTSSDGKMTSIHINSNNYEPRHVPDMSKGVVCQQKGRFLSPGFLMGRQES